MLCLIGPMQEYAPVWLADPPIGGEVQTVDLLQVPLQENNAAACPKVPNSAKGIQASDCTTHRSHI